MSNSQTTLIKGNWASLLMPLQADDQIDWSALEEEIDILTEVRPAGIYSNGTACEFYNQSIDEFQRIQSLLSEKCLAVDLPFQIGCSDNNPRVLFDKIEIARALKPTAIQLVLPDWSPLSDAELVGFLKDIIDIAAPMPVVLYNPPHAKRVLKPSEFKSLLDSGIQLAGVKVAGGDQNWYAEMRAVANRMSVFIPGHFLASGVLAGMHGAYSNMSCLNPRAAQVWYESIFTHSEEALELEKRLQEFLKLYIHPLMTDRRLSNQGADKLMAAIGNWGPISPRLRWPYKGADLSIVEGIRLAASQLIPEFIKI